MDDLSIARWRMHTLRLTGHTFPSASAAVEGMLGVQAENHSQASWAVSTRTAGTTQAEFDRLFDDGEILRTHVLRPTWHFVRPDDIWWLVDVTAPRILRNLRLQKDELGLHESHFDRAHEVIADALATGAHLTRQALAERLEGEGLPAGGRQLGTLLMSAEFSGIICSGSLDGKDHTYALLSDRAPNARRLDRSEALAELALRYFTGHGPATERDLSYWASLTLTDVRAGLAGVSDQLESFEHDGRTYWFGEPAPNSSRPAPRAHILQVLDEYHNGYQDSRYALDAVGIVPRGRGANVGMVLVDGQMVGGMKRSIQPESVRFELNLFREIDPEERAAIEAAAHRYGSFLGRTVDVAMS